MIIICEGSDRTGKSTLADHIAAAVGADTIVEHRGVPERDVLDEYVTSIEDVQTSIVADRWHVGQRVYSPLYRDTDTWGELGVAGWRWVELWLASRGASLFIVEQPIDVVLDRMRRCGEDYLQEEDVEWVLNEFATRGPESLNYVATITPPPLDELDSFAATLVEDCRKAASAAEPLRSHPTYIGGIRPRVLLVGEKRGGVPPFRSQSCFMPIRGRSGEFLLAALPQDTWKEYGLVNAYEDDDLLGLIEKLGSPTVVALGRSASDRLIELDVEHGGVPHPAYVKRFHNKKQTEYGQLIESVSQTQSAAFSWPNS